MVLTSDPDFLQCQTVTRKCKMKPSLSPYPSWVWLCSFTIATESIAQQQVIATTRYWGTTEAERPIWGWWLQVVVSWLSSLGPMESLNIIVGTHGSMQLLTLGGPEPERREPGFHHLFQGHTLTPNSSHKVTRPKGAHYLSIVPQLLRPSIDVL